MAFFGALVGIAEKSVAVVLVVGCRVASMKCPLVASLPWGARGAFILHTSPRQQTSG